MAPFRRAEWPGQRCRGGNLPPERIRAERGELRYQPYLHSPGQTLPAFIGFPTPPCAVPARPGTPGPWGERGGNDGFGHGAIALFYKWAIQSAASAKGYRSPITVFVVVHRFPQYLKTDSWTIMIRLPLCAESSCPIRYRIFFVPRDFGVAKALWSESLSDPRAFLNRVLYGTSALGVSLVAKHRLKIAWTLASVSPATHPPSHARRARDLRCLHYTGRRAERQGWVNLFLDRIPLWVYDRHTPIGIKKGCDPP